MKPLNLNIKSATQAPSVTAVDRAIAAEQSVRFEQASANRMANPVAVTKPTGVSRATPPINIYDRNVVANYGAKTQNSIGKYADDVLTTVRTSSMDVVGPKLVSIVEIAKELDPSDLLGASKLPFIGGLVKKFTKSRDRFVAKFNTLSDQIEKVVVEIDRTSDLLVKRIDMLEDMYQGNMAEYRELETLIEDGDVVIAEENQKLAEAKSQLPPNPTPIETQQLADRQQAVRRFEKKIADLRAIQMLCVQTMPEIRLIQSGNELLVEKFNTAKTHTIPVWKKQFVLAVSLDEQKKGAQLSETIDNATNEFARRNAALLGENATLVARQSQRAVIDTETLEECQRSLINTFTEINQIEAQGVESRKQAALKFENMKTELHQATVEFVAARIR